MKVAMLLLAAGRGSRFGGPIPKAYLPLLGKALVVHSAERLAQVVDLRTGNQLVVVVHADDREQYLHPLLPALRTLGDVRFANGGASRQESMQNGLAMADADCDLVLVHDAARALFPVAAARECVVAAAQHGASLLALPAPDTLKRVRDGAVETTVDRTGIWLAQTPQVIRRELLLRAFAHADRTGFQGTDDVSLVEHLGAPVTVVTGSATNLKITRPEDLPLASALLGAGLA